MTTRREKTYKNSNPVRQFIMAPAPSLSSRRCCRQGPLRTMSPPCPPSIASGSKHRRGGPSKHVNQSVVSSLHRTAEASVAVEGLRNTYIMSVAIAMSYPHRSAEANIAGGGPSKHVAAFPNRGPHSIAHSGSKRRQWRAYWSSRCQNTSLDASCGTHTSRKWLGVLRLLAVDHVCRPPGRTFMESSGGYSYFALWNFWRSSTGNPLVTPLVLRVLGKKKKKRNCCDPEMVQAGVVCIIRKHTHALLNV